MDNSDLLTRYDNDLKYMDKQLLFCKKEYCNIGNSDCEKKNGRKNHVYYNKLKQRKEKMLDFKRKSESHWISKRVPFTQNYMFQLPSYLSKQGIDTIKLNKEATSLEKMWLIEKKFFLLYIKKFYDLEDAEKKNWLNQKFLYKKK